MSGQIPVIAMTRFLPEDSWSALNNNRSMPRAYTGFDIGPFFVHTSISDNRGACLSVIDDADLWHVTHKPTGFAAKKGIPSHPRAIWLARKLMEFDIWEAVDPIAIRDGIPADMRARITALCVDAIYGDCQGEIA